jgi:2',3'-cyclic-nucleotide 2'-phosphodiesterase (5'-nucleotidase family)
LACNAARSYDNATSTTVTDIYRTFAGIHTALGPYLLSTGADAFEVDNGILYLKAGTKLDFETQPSYTITVAADDTSVGATPDASTTYTLTVTDIANEGSKAGSVYISEIAPWSSGNSKVAADWFEVTNGSAAELDITGWRVDDSSAVFEQGAALSGVTKIAPGESVIFIEGADAKAASDAFATTWFGGTLPAGLQIGTYTGKGIGLSTGGDEVNLYNAAGELQAGVSFGASPSAAPFASFNNAAALNGMAVTTLSEVGVNGAKVAASTADEIGSPGTVGRLFISEIAPWSSGSSPIKADWFELTNSTAFTIDLTGWKMDDSSGSPAAAVSLNGVSSIAPGESVIFMESANPAAATKAFLSNWFGIGAPAGLQIGTYTGSGVGLGSGGDGVHIYDSSNTLQAAVSFGASPEGPYTTFDNSAGLNGTAVTITTMSKVGENKAFTAVNSANEVGSPGGRAPGFTLQILHFYGETGTLGAQTAPVMGAMMDKFRTAVPNTLTLAEGDSWIPGPWLAAGADPSVSKVAGIGSTALARPDVAIMNALGVNASALGNHEFDLGSPVVSGAIAPSGAWGGAKFPFITSNLDFSKDSSLRGLADATLGGTGTNAFAGQEASSIGGKIAPYAVVTINGERIGIVGSTTYDLLIKTSPNGTRPLDDGNDATSDIQEVAAYLQTGIDVLKATGIDKIVMVDQLDTLDRNKELAPLLTGVDVMVAGGGHERLGDATDVPGAFNGHSPDFIATDSYPIITKGADGAPTLIVTTDTEYSYLGRLVVAFTEDGEIDLASLDPVTNGAYASNESTLQAVYGSTDTAQQIIDSSTTGKAVQAITSAVDAVVVAKDGNKFGFSNVYLEGDRVFGRAQEVNLGNLTADANAAAALGALPAGTPVVVSMKNGGGLRASIGSIDEDGSKIPNATTAGAGGNVSQLDVENALRFDNKLMVFDTTPQGLLNILNFAAGLAPGNGGFPQLGGLRFSYDPDLPAGQKVRSLALYDLDGNFVAQIAANGQVVAGAPSTIPVVILNFTANGGDGYPVKANGENFRYLLNDGTLSAPVDEALDFTAGVNVPANTLGEQKALEDYLQAEHGTPETAYNQADTPASQDLRIENLNLRDDAVLLGSEQTFTVAAHVAHLPEGSSGTTDFTFTVTRSGDTAEAAEIGWSVAGVAGNGTVAARAQDFAGGTLPSGMVSFAAGQTSQIITVPVAADTAGESNERFAVSLGSLPSGAAFVGNAAHGVILNDDAARYSVGPAREVALEGTGGSSTMSFTVSRAGTSTGTETLDWAVSPGSAPGTLPASAADFEGGVLPSGTVTFAPGQNTATIMLPLATDAQREFNESFTLGLSNPSGGATIGRATATGVIIDDDTIVVLGSTPVSGTEAANVFLIGPGEHTVSGLGGVDRFVFTGAVGAEAGNNLTGLPDFDPAAGERIDLRLIDAIAGGPVNNAFTYIGINGFSGTPGELRVLPSGGSMVISGDTNGDGVANFQITAGTVASPSASWFLL